MKILVNRVHHKTEVTARIYQFQKPGQKKEPQ